MAGKIELLETWMKERKMTKSMLSREINVSVSYVCAAMKHDNEKSTRYGAFWNAVAKLTENKTFEVKVKASKKSDCKMNIPEYVERMLMSYGKTVINKRIIKKIGEKGLIDYFAGKGIKCEIKVEQDETNEPYHYLIMI